MGKTSRWLGQDGAEQQVEIFGEDQVSLDSLWRSVASPSGHDPRRWSSDLAAPLLSGFAAYLSRLDGDDDATADPVADALDLAGRLERPLAHRRPDDARVHRLGLRHLSRRIARQPDQPRGRNAGSFVIGTG